MFSHTIYSRDCSDKSIGCQSLLKFLACREDYVLYKLFNEACLCKFGCNPSRYIYHHLLGHEVKVQMVRNALPRRFGAPGLLELNASQESLKYRLLGSEGDPYFSDTYPFVW